MSPTDLLLAPVAVEIERNLQRLRELDSAAIVGEPTSSSIVPRVVRSVARSAGRESSKLRCETSISTTGTQRSRTTVLDCTSTAGSVSLGLGLSAAITRHVAGGS